MPKTPPEMIPYREGSEEDETPRHQSNAEVIAKLMNFGTPMKQLVILEAVMRYTERIVDMTLEGYRAHCGDSSFVSPDAWFHACQEIHTTLTHHLTSK